MPHTSRTYGTKPARLFNRPAKYARIDLGDEEELRQLGRSYLERPLYPVIADATTLEVYDGNRRITGVMLVDPNAEVPVCLIDEAWSDSVKLEIQIESAGHTRGLSDYEQYAGCSEWLKLNPTATAKELAGRIKRNEAILSMLLSLSRCVQAVQDAARAGRIGYTVWYQLSKLPPGEQLAELAEGTTCEKAKARRHNGNGHADGEKVSSIKIALAGNVTVTIKGKDLNLTRSSDALRAAAKEIEFAKAQNLNAKTAQAAWKDRATRPKPKDAEPEKANDPADFRGVAKG